jgi:hypothetical protein
MAKEHYTHTDDATGLDYAIDLDDDGSSVRTLTVTLLDAHEVELARDSWQPHRTPAGFAAWMPWMDWGVR